MSKRVEPSTTKEYLIKAPLPQQTATYTVIPHQAVIDKTLLCLQNHGFEVEHELYRATQNANIAQGVYNLKHVGDPDMGLMFAWSNSYDKSMSFRCAIGSRIYVSNSRIIPADMGHWKRVHTGTADQDTNKQIDDQISNAGMHFAQLVKDKETMKKIHVPLRRAAEFLGILLIEKKIISSEQLNLIREQLKKPSFDYKVDPESLWSLYNHIIFSLQKSHPRLWMDQQRLCHYYICEDFKVQNFIPITPEPPKPVVDPAQMSLLDQPGVIN